MSVTKYAGIAANTAWTCGWAAAAYRAMSGIQIASNASLISTVIITSTLSALGLFMTLRLFGRTPQIDDSKRPSEPQTWLHRASGGFAVFGWCSASVIWNFGTFATLLRLAAKRDATFVLVMIPFTVIGWFLLNLLFVSIGVILDSLF